MAVVCWCAAVLMVSLYIFWKNNVLLYLLYVLPDPLSLVSLAMRWCCAIPGTWYTAWIDADTLFFVTCVISVVIVLMVLPVRAV